MLSSLWYGGGVPNKITGSDFFRARAKRSNHVKTKKASTAKTKREKSDPPRIQTFPTPEITVETFGGLAKSKKEVEQLLRARTTAERQFLPPLSQQAKSWAKHGVTGLGNIVGVGIGEKEIGGIPTARLCVQVFVKEKLNPQEVRKEALIPREINGVPTDIIAVGDVKASYYVARRRPALGGISIGNCNLRFWAGTFGCLVSDNEGLYILSNNHVLTGMSEFTLGTGIPQPGREDSGVCSGDVIATLARYIPISFSSDACNQVDCALAKVSQKNLVDPRILRPSSVKEFLVSPETAPVLNADVQKSGKTTQYRRGKVYSVAATYNVPYSPHTGEARFCNQFLVLGTNQRFAAGGDSGSLVTTFPKNQPVGLLFATTTIDEKPLAICNPISTVLSALGVSIVYS